MSQAIVLFVRYRLRNRLDQTDVEPAEALEFGEDVGFLSPALPQLLDYTLYRGAEGRVHLLDARCVHRRTQLSAGWVEGDAIRCFYHGWKYDHTGQCVEQPAEPKSFAHKVTIGSYPRFLPDGPEVEVVLKSADAAALAAAVAWLEPALADVVANRPG